jgi:hypothetical protein
MKKMLCVALLLCASGAVRSADDPMVSVRDLYSWSLAPAGKGLLKPGADLQSLSAHRADFTPGFYDCLAAGLQSFPDFQAKKRKNFLDCDPFTWTQANLMKPPHIGMVQVTGQQAIAPVTMAVYSYTRPEAPPRTFKLEVDLVQVEGQWKIDNLRFQSPDKVNVRDSLKDYEATPEFSPTPSPSP